MSALSAPFAASGNYSSIGGALPWGSGGNPVGQTSLSGLAGQYAQSYNSALNMNRSNYGNILSGYQNALTSQQAAQQALQSGYSNLYNNTVGTISGLGSAQAQQIHNQFVSSLGQQNQDLINRGLGNTTVQSAVDRGNNTAEALALSQNAQNFAGLQAQYMSQLGLAGLANQQNAYQANTALQGQQLNWMNSVNAPYPDAGLYANLASQYGNKGSGGILPSWSTPGLGYTGTGGPAQYDSGSAPSYGSSGYGGGGNLSALSNPQPNYNFGSTYGEPATTAAVGAGYGALGAVSNYSTPYSDAFAAASSGALNGLDQSWGGGGDF